MRPEDVDPPIRAAQGRDFYLAYLNSSSWRITRNRALKNAGYRCERCSSKLNPQVHHKTYDRLGGEWDSDLEVLCANCHEGETIKQTEQSDNGIYLKLASVTLRVRPFDSVSELADVVKTQCAIHKIRYDSHQVDRALELITGSRLTRITPAVRVDGTVPSPLEISRQEAHELLMRLQAVCGAFAPKSMPAQRESNLEAVRAAREQIDAAEAAKYRRERERKPLAERLADIFAEPLV